MGSEGSPIGAGDTVGACCFAHILHACRALGPRETLRAAQWADAFAWGLAAGSASCQYVEGAMFDVVEVQRIRGQIKVREVTEVHGGTS